MKKLDGYIQPRKSPIGAEIIRLSWTLCVDGVKNEGLTQAKDKPEYRVKNWSQYKQSL